MSALKPKRAPTKHPRCQRKKFPVARLVPVALGVAVAITPASTPESTKVRVAGAPGHPNAPGPAFRCTNTGSFHPKRAGLAVTATLSLGGVTATFTASPVHQPGAGFATFRRPRLTFAAPGGLSRSVAVSPPWGFSSLPGTVELVGLTGQLSGSPFCVARFASPSPEVAVLVGTYSGGAHCCTWVEAVVVEPASEAGAKPTWQDIGNPGARLKGDAGKALLVTADNSFAYAFDSYARSGMPVRVLELVGHKFVATTRGYPSLVQADARLWWAQYTEVAGPKGQEPGGGLGLLAPWVADECLLGRSSSAWATVARLQSEGRLDGGTPGWPRGAAYVKALRSFLARDGYCPH